MVSAQKLNMWKILVLAFLVGSFSSETKSSRPQEHYRFDRDVEAGPPAIVREYLQNLYNYRPQTTQLEDEVDYRSFDNNFTPIPPGSGGSGSGGPGSGGNVPSALAVSAVTPAAALADSDSGGMESRSRDNYNHYTPPTPRGGGSSTDNIRRPFPPNPPYPRSPSRPRPPYQDDHSGPPHLVNNFRDRDESDDYFSDLPDDDEVETDAPFPHPNPNTRNYNPNYNQRPPSSNSRRPAQAAAAGCGSGCGGGGGGGGGGRGGGDALPKPPGNLYDDQTGRERGEPSYRFGYDLHDQSRHENADRFGNVNGYFSFVDDEGTFNKVSYSAGAQKGFVVNHKEPADAPAPQPPQRTRSPNIRRNPNEGNGGSRRNSNVHASSYPPRGQHHNPFGNKQNNKDRQNPNSKGPSADDELLGAGLGIVVGLSNNNNKGGGGGGGRGREGRGGGGSDSWSRNKVANSNGVGVGTSTVVTTVSSLGDSGHHPSRHPSDDPFGTVNGTSDGAEHENGTGDGGDGGAKPWGAFGGNGPSNGQRPRHMRKRKPAYVVKVKRPAGNGPAWQYNKPPNPGRPAPGGDDGNYNNNNWQHNQNRPHPQDNNFPQSQDDLDGGVYGDGSDGSEGSDFDPYPKDKSYSFGYKTGDSTRQEASDAYGNIRGSYSYVDPAGVTRIVHYSAGNSGFKVLNAQPSILRPVYADSPVTVQSIPIPVAVTSQLSQLRQPSAIVYHIHPDNGLGSEWKPWESSRVKGPVYHHQRPRSHHHQLAPLISSSSPSRSGRSRSQHRSRSQKQQILQGNTFRLTHQNHRFFPAYSNIYEPGQSDRESTASSTTSEQQDIQLNPTFHVNPEDVETISSHVVNGIDNSADIEANQLYLKQLQRQQIRQQNKLRRLSQQYQQQIISTPVFQYSRKHPRYMSAPTSSNRYYYRDRLQQYPSQNDDNEILWTQQDNNYSDFEFPPSQSNVVSVFVPNSNNASNYPRSRVNNNGNVITTFHPNSNSNANPNANGNFGRRRSSSRERGQKRHSSSNFNRLVSGNSKERNSAPKNTSNNVNSNNVMNITEILPSTGAGAVNAVQDAPTTTPIPIPTPPMSVTVPMTMTMAIEGEPDIQTFQGGYGDKNPLLVMSQQSASSSSEVGGIPSSRLQREIPLETAQSVNSLSIAMSLIPALETDLVAMPMPMPLGVVIPDSQMAESIMNPMIASSASIMRIEDLGSLELMKISSKNSESKKEEPKDEQTQDQDADSSSPSPVVVLPLQQQKTETEPEATKSVTTMSMSVTNTEDTKTKGKAKATEGDEKEPKPVVKMSPAARLTAKMASAPLSSPVTKDSASSSSISSTTAVPMPVTMTNSGMVAHYPGGRTEPLNEGSSPTGVAASKEMLMMTA